MYEKRKHLGTGEKLYFPKFYNPFGKNPYKVIWGRDCKTASQAEEISQRIQKKINKMAEKKHLSYIPEAC